MASRFFYLNPITENESVNLPPDQAHHLVHVLRQKVGSVVELVDGKGRIAYGSVATIHGSAVTVRIEKIEIHPANSKVTLAFAIPKGPALEFIFRKCTEVGVEAFQPLITQHSLSPDRWNAQRWEKIVAETIKQCQSPHVPQIYPPLELRDWLSLRDSAKTLFFCDEAKRKSEGATPAQPQGCDVLVGAEGGWSKEEVSQIAKLAPTYLGLGANRLRAETACLVAIVLGKKTYLEL